MENLVGKRIIITLLIVYLLVGEYLLFEHFFRVLVVLSLLVISHLPGQKPTMKTGGVRVASWEGLKGNNNWSGLDI